MLKAYEGNEPYIFVSYAHKDKDEVLYYVEELQKRGYRVWYDAGIAVGSEWPENIATHLRKCSLVLSFISDHFVESDNCNREITFAQELKIRQLNVFLQGVLQEELPDGLRLQLVSNQGIFRENFETDEAFVEELAAATVLEECRSASPEQNAVTAEKKPQKKRGSTQLLDRLYERSGATTKERRDTWQRGSKALVWIGILIELAYIPLSNSLVVNMAISGKRFVFIALALVLVHGFLGWLNSSLFSYVFCMVKRAALDRKPLKDALFYMRLASFVSVIVPIFSQIEIVLDCGGLSSGIFSAFSHVFSPYVGGLFAALYLNLYSIVIPFFCYFFMARLYRKAK